MQVIKASSDFRTTAAKGRRWSSSAYFLQVIKKEEAPFRVGFTASRKVGGAVQRNRAKRRLRAMVRSLAPQLHGADVVIIAKTTALEADFTHMQAEFIKAMRALGVFKSAP